MSLTQIMEYLLSKVLAFFVTRFFMSLLTQQPYEEGKRGSEREKRVYIQILSATEQEKTKL